MDPFTAVAAGPRWTRAMLRLLGTVSDHVLAKRFGIPLRTVSAKRWRNSSRRLSEDVDVPELDPEGRRHDLQEGEMADLHRQALEAQAEADRNAGR